MPDYKIKEGDTLTRLAKRFGVSVSALAKANNIDDPDKIYIGDNLQVPDVRSQQLQQMVKSLLSQQQGQPAQVQSPMPQFPPQLTPQSTPPMQQGGQGMPQGMPPGMQGRPPQMPPQPHPGIANPQQDAIQQSMPEAMMAGVPGMMRGMGNMAMGGLGAMAKGMPQMAKAGRIQPPQGYSNVVPMGNSGAFNSSMAQAMLNGKGGGLPQGAVGMDQLIKMMRTNYPQNPARSALMKQYGIK